MLRPKNHFRIPAVVFCSWAFLCTFLPCAIAQITEDDCNTDGCTNHSVGDTNIMDLGTGSYGTLQGGLYPQGINIRPPSHNAAGLAFADQVVPRDINGNPDFVDGKIVLLSVGFSNAQQEFSYFRDKVKSLEQINPYLVVVNGAIGGWPIEEIIDPEINDVYWQGTDTDPPLRGVEDMLEKADVTWSQVQAIWFKTANLSPESTQTNGFLNYVHGLRNQYIAAMSLLQEKFVNNRLCYLSDRTFGGYSLDLGNPEPFAYWTGWAVKRLIETQINGDLPYDVDPVSPWLSWGPYLWADGYEDRSDLVKWECRDFRDDDRRHPSDCGKDKVADLLIDFFSSDETTRPWFTRTKLVNSGGDLYMSVDQDRFGEDDGYDRGTTSSTSSSIDGTLDDDLYRDFREGASEGSGGFDYNFPLPNSGDGVYHVTLHFMEPVATSAGQRVFDVRCEGDLVENNLDIFQRAGGANLTAFTVEFDKAVSDEMLTIRFLDQGSTYKPLVCAIAIDYLRSGSGERVTEAEAPATVLMDQNFPNPFNPSTTIRYVVPRSTFVTLKVYDILGKLIETLVSEKKEAGVYSVEWNAGQQPSGVYFCRLDAGEHREVRKLVLLK